MCPVSLQDAQSSLLKESRSHRRGLFRKNRQIRTNWRMKTLEREESINPLLTLVNFSFSEAISSCCLLTAFTLFLIVANRISQIYDLKDEWVSFRISKPIILTLWVPPTFHLKRSNLRRSRRLWSLLLWACRPEPPLAVIRTNGRIPMSSWFESNLPADGVAKLQTWREAVLPDLRLFCKCS